MINGLYSATSGMYVQQMRLDVISSNIANANVPGFKGERLMFRSFPDVLRVETQRAAESPRALGPLGGGAELDEIATMHDSGPMVFTQQETDLAIFGEGFFHLQTPDGERLTRNGSFVRDLEGFLRNVDGHLLLGENGPIQIVEADFEVSADGNVYVDRRVPLPGGRVETRKVRLDQLKLTRPEDPDALRRLGNSLYFIPTGRELPVQPGETRVGQGYLETANVSAIEESIRLIDTFRAYQSAQRLVQAIDETLDQAVNDVGRS